MILSGRLIEKLNGNKITISPFNKGQLNPNSYNLKLDNELLVYEEDVLDMKKENKTSKIIIGDNGFALKPGKLYLGKTIEETASDYYISHIEGRSSLARLGLFVHICAGLGNIGSSGCWTLELACVQPIRIYPGIEVCQIYFSTIEGEYDLYSQKYKGKTTVEASMMYKELEGLD